MKCSICGVAEIDNSDDEERDYCITCYMTGTYFEERLASDERSNMLERIRELPQVVQARVWHHGDGAFQLAITLADGRLITPGLGGFMNGQKIVVPLVVPVDEGWGVLVRASDNAVAVAMPDKYDDDELVEFIAGQTVALP